MLTRGCAQQSKDGLKLKLQVGQLKQGGVWTAFAPGVSTVAQGETQQEALDNLCEQVEDFLEFLVETGRSLASADSGESLAPYSHELTVEFKIPRYASPCLNNASYCREATV